MNENLPYEHTNVTTFQVEFIKVILTNPRYPDSKFKCVMNE